MSKGDDGVEITLGGYLCALNSFMINIFLLLQKQIKNTTSMD